MPHKFILTLLALSPVVQAQSFIFPPPPPELTMIFRPFETNDVTLSPNGRHLAYTERQGGVLFLVLRDLQANTLKRVTVGIDQALELSGAREKTPAHLSFMRWAHNDRLVFNVGGMNVWSIGADGNNPRRIADPTDYRKPTPSGPSGAAPSVIETIKADMQPVTVSSLPRGGQYVFVEAIMHRRGAMIDVKVSASGELSVGEIPSLGGPPRVVQRFDVTTGKAKEWAEVPRSDFLLSDQQGYPRIIRQRAAEESSHSLHKLFLHADPGRARWQPLDRLIDSHQLAQFHETPTNWLRERSIPLAFDYAPDLLYFASNVGRDTFGIYSLDTKTWQRTEVAVETLVADLGDPQNPLSDSLVFDHWQRRLVGIRYTGSEPATLWLDNDLREVQQTLDATDEEKRWKIIEWDEARERFLILASSNSEPGIYYIFNRDALQLDEVTSQAPWLTEAGRNPSDSFGFQTPTGVNLSGYLTLPRKPILQRPPLVVLVHDGPWSRDYPGYNREAQALAWMGFMVLQVNFRGSAGFGQNHLNAAREGFDTVPLDDILSAIEAVTPKNVDRRLVAIMGTGYGGYLALRAMQLHPTRFRCAVAIDAPTDLNAWVRPTDFQEELQTASTALSFFDSPWLHLSDSRGVFAGAVRREFFGTDSGRLRELSPLSHPEKIVGPVMVIQREGSAIGRGREFVRSLAKHGRHAEFISLNEDEGADRPHARAALFTKIHGFLNENIYNYAVTLGDAVEVDAEKD